MCVNVLQQLVDTKRNSAQVGASQLQQVWQQLWQQLAPTSTSKFSSGNKLKIPVWNPEGKPLTTLPSPFPTVWTTQAPAFTVPSSSPLEMSHPIPKPESKPGFQPYMKPGE